MSRTRLLGVCLTLVALVALAGCASTEQAADAEFPPTQPPATAAHYKATAPGQFPVDVYLAAWGEGYVVYTPGTAPLYLASDKKGGYIIQSPGESARFVVPRPDGSGWNILSASEPATLLLRQKEGGWILQPPGELPTLIQPQPQ
jgi:hypothetical protein